jgi:flagellar basal body-associated protein FliL
MHGLNESSAPDEAKRKGAAQRPSPRVGPLVLVLILILIRLVLLVLLVLLFLLFLALTVPLSS